MVLLSLSCLRSNGVQQDGGPDERKDADSDDKRRSIQDEQVDYWIGLAASEYRVRRAFSLVWIWKRDRQFGRLTLLADEVSIVSLCEFNNTIDGANL
jgi:hypothetical protein